MVKIISTCTANFDELLISVIGPGGVRLKAPARLGYLDGIGQVRFRLGLF